MRTKKRKLIIQVLFKLLLCLGVVAAIAYCTICLYLYFQQPRFIFFPSSVIEKTPESFGLPYESVWLPVPATFGKVEHIHGWWIKANELNPKVLLESAR
jgi:uncharacterized protein